MKKIISCPGKFVVGSKEIEHLGEYLAPYGNKALLVAVPDDVARVQASLDAIGNYNVELVYADFGGECTQAEIDRLGNLCRTTGASVVVGLGGGKALDTAKGVAFGQGLPLVVVPTIAASDAPCSTLIILYDENHTMCGFLKVPKSPDVCLVDSAVIAKAPVRFLIAGIGDAYATYYEAKVCMATGGENYVGGMPTNAAWAMAELCNKILLADAAKAVQACRLNLVTPALENVIEANILLSGLGFESVGCAAAHSLHNSLTVLEDTHKAMHGEKVAIGLLAQMVLANVPSEEVREVVNFYRQVGLPMTLAEIGITEDVDAKLHLVAQAAVKQGAIQHHPFEITEERVFGALKSVDGLKDLY